MEPNYRIDEITEKVIIELVEKVAQLGLGNVGFFGYPTTTHTVFFSMQNCGGYWMLNVVLDYEYGSVSDAYEIVNGRLIFKTHH